MKKVLFINIPPRAYSVHMMGWSLFRILEKSRQYHYYYGLPASREDVFSELMETEATTILCNHLSIESEWFDAAFIQELRSHNVRLFAFCSHGMIFSRPGFDGYFVPDPRMQSGGNIYTTGRPLPAATTKPVMPHEVPVIGTAGHLQPHKQFPQTVSRIIAEFDRAHIRLAIGKAEIAPYDLADARQCVELVDACGKAITITIETKLMPVNVLVDWLADNDLNVYLYANGTGGPAPAMGPDTALAARRPIAVTRTAPGLSLFHDCSPSVCIEDSNLKTIMANGIAPLEPLYREFADENILNQIETCLLGH